MKKLIIGIFIATILMIQGVNPVLARRGCCSHHAGVCGCDTSIGSQICCDGSYSPSCTCAYIPQRNIYTPPKFPDITATWSWHSNINGTWKIEMKLSDNNPTKYSAVISKCAGCDPGPKVDFYSNDFTFDNVSPGKWYVNVKKEINGNWSTVTYWTLDIPEWESPTPTSTNIPFITNLDSENNNKNHYGSSPLIYLSLGGLISYLIIKKIKQKKS